MRLKLSRHVVYREICYVKGIIELFSKMWSTEQKIAMVELFHKHQNYSIVRRKFAARFGFVGRRAKEAPCQKTIQRVVENFKNKGTVLSDKHGRSGRLRTVRTTEKIAEVRESVTRSPKKSLEVRRQELGISKQMTAVILKQELKLFPYKISTHHKLIDSDISRRLAMCEKLHRKMGGPSTMGRQTDLG